MIPAPLFPPSFDTAAERIAAIDPVRYARTRNALDGAVSQLSPYITHGLVTLTQILAGVAARRPLSMRDKFVFELVGALSSGMPGSIEARAFSLRCSRGRCRMTPMSPRFPTTCARRALVWR